MAEPVDKKVLKQFVPSNALKAENFEELASKTFLETVHAGKTIFKEGDSDKKAIYVVEGQVEIAPGSPKDEDITTPAGYVVEAGSEKAKHALANRQPRKQSAIAKTDCKIEIGVESHDKLYRNPFLDPLAPHELKADIATKKEHKKK